MKKYLIAFYLITILILACAEPVNDAAFWKWTIYEGFILINLINAVRLANKWFKTI